MKTFLTFFLLSTLSTFVLGQEECEAKGGTCLDYTEYICHGGVEQGICPGDNDIRCCLPCDQECEDNENEWDGSNGGSSYADEGCQDLDGLCFDNTNYCDGIYDSDTSICGNSDSDGLNRECCRPFDESRDCPAIISREEWDARDPTGVTAMPDNVPYLFIHHSAGADCYTQAECEEEVRAIQDYHMDGNGWNDIGYSFLIGGDGNVYEGRGWNVVGAHTSGFNDVGYGIDFIGTFSEKDPEDIAQEAYFQFANCAPGLGKVISSYELYGHRQTASTECPGDYFYNTIKTDPYPHYTEGCIADDGICYNP